MTLTKNRTIFTLETGLEEHAVYQAWNRLSIGASPVEVVVLEETRKSLVCKLPKVGPSNGDVIAKRSRRDLAEFEREIYENILPKLPLRSLHFYGLVEDSDCNYCWIFIEDAGSEIYSPSKKEHRVAAARWLGVLHTTSTNIVELKRLEDRGSQYHLNCLQLARKTIQSNLSNPWLNSDDLNLLRDIVLQFNTIENRWNNIEEFCDKMPQTLVHGDFRIENLRVQNSPTGLILLPFDWEHSGRGIPAVDLVGRKYIDISTYWSTVRNEWPDFDSYTVRQLDRLGRIFRAIVSIYWASWALEDEWMQPWALEYWVKPCLENMRLYKSWIDAELKNNERMAKFSCRRS